MKHECMIEAKHVKVTLTADALASSISSPYKNVQIRVTCAESPPQYSPVALEPPPNAAWAAMTPDTTPAASQSRKRAAQTSPCGAPFLSQSHMLTHCTARAAGGDHHHHATRCCSRAGPAPTLPLAQSSSVIMSSTLRTPAARPLDAAPMKCGLWQHAWRRTRVSV